MLGVAPLNSLSPPFLYCNLDHVSRSPPASLTLRSSVRHLPHIWSWGVRATQTPFGVERQAVISRPELPTSQTQ